MDDRYIIIVEFKGTANRIEKTDENASFIDVVNKQSTEQTGAFKKM